jgi:hypothetical protein
MKGKRFVNVLVLFILIVFGCKREPEDDQPLIFTPIDLENFSKNFRGFNLLGKVDVAWSNNGYLEEEFIILKDLGFNFVRLPLDYRAYTMPGNWNFFQDDDIAEIDNAVAWGKQYGIHVCIDLHHAPGYCVNPSLVPANQNLDLWTDAEAQEAFVNHWAFFAKRYKDIPYEELSFNLVNEPKDMDEAAYMKVMKKAIDKIQSISPDRVIYVDGLNYAREVIPSLGNEKNVIQSIHVYDPMTVTHYKAEWVEGSENWPLPVWPMADIPQYIYGPWQSNYQSSLVFEGNFTKDSEFIINVRQVSNRSVMQIKLDDAEILNKEFICGAVPGEDWSEILLTQWGYQNISNKDYSVILPSDGARITISNTDGDWLSFNKITIRNATSEVVIIAGNTSWGLKQEVYKITADGKLADSGGNPLLPLRDFRSNLELARSLNIPVMIQEFGVYNKTPYDVTIKYMDDIVSIFRQSDIGFAMWNMIGTMGIINSGRPDCDYEEYRGKLLDRKMTNIMQGRGN